MRSFLRRHGIHPVEAILLVVGALLPVYKLITLALPAPTLPPEFYLPALCVILAGLYLTEKLRSWTGKPVLHMDSTIEKIRMSPAFASACGTIAGQSANHECAWKES
jgi:hypothetical protein